MSSLLPSRERYYRDDTIVAVAIAQTPVDSDRISKHFCMMARTLEVVGERWSLLIVRDLLLGPRRFGDLASGLGQITPTRLTDRLRRLEAAGIVVREPPSAGRDVWYRLTDAGRDLEATVDSLVVRGDRARPRTAAAW
jgi:DNA-binding HxlR family transcriptional regulator